MPVMALGIRRAGGFLAATAKGIATWDTQHKMFEPFCDPLAGRAGFRFNDAATDIEGRFWVGTLNDANPKGPDGELFCIQGNGSCQLMDKNITVANGIGWSPDRNNHVFYRFFPLQHLRLRLCGRKPERFPIAGRSCRLLRKAGYPDGLTVDSEGFVWSAYCGGWRVVRYNPEGKVDREYRFPVANPTSCAFGGERHGRTLHHLRHSGAERERQRKSTRSRAIYFA